VINTCSVTDFADKKCRYEVRRALKYSPNAKIVVIGCYAQLKPKEISEIPGVDLVLGAAEKFNVVNYVEELSKVSGKGMIKAGDVSEANTFVDAFSFGDRTRTFLKVQDGCNYKCSFCTIPQARGSSRSDTIENVIENIQKIAKLGSREIVLTGVNIGDFGNGTEVIEGTKPKKEALFIDLINAIENEETDIQRFRISSIEPNLCTDEILETIARSEKFVPHFHMPLQSGSDKLLALMKRRYKRDLYVQRVNKIKKLMPHACIGVDVIVGFPGETDEDFNETYNFLKDLDISYLHVFTYSERNNTVAAEMEDIVPMQVRKQRNKMLRILSDKKKRAFYKSHLNQERSVLIEKGNSEANLSGFTDNYIKVITPYQDDLINSTVKVKLIDFDEEGNIISQVIPTERLVTH
jgi:threonylcarbamoyladenosine tRNA methylthiotransferase MtaB